MCHNTHNFKEPNVFSQSSDASTEGDEEHDHPEHNEKHSMINEECATHCVCGNTQNHR